MVNDIITIEDLFFEKFFNPKLPGGSVVLAIVASSVVFVAVIDGLLVIIIVGCIVVNMSADPSTFDDDVVKLAIK